MFRSEPSGDLNEIAPNVIYIYVIIYKHTLTPSYARHREEMPEANHVTSKANFTLNSFGILYFLLHHPITKGTNTF